MKPIKAPIVYEELTYKLIGIAINIHKNLGPVHKEIIYQNAFSYELEKQKIPFEKEVGLKVKYKGKNIGFYKPDFLIDKKVIIEIKALEFLPASALSQISYYLKGTGYRVGLLLNFGSPKLQIKRRIYG